LTIFKSASKAFCELFVTEDNDLDDTVSKLKRLKEKIQSDSHGDLNEDFDVDGEMTVRVIGEDGSEKHREVKSFDGGE